MPVMDVTFSVSVDDPEDLTPANDSQTSVNMSMVFQTSVVGPSGPWVSSTLVLPGADVSLSVGANSGTVWLRAHYVSSDGRVAPQSDWSLVAAIGMT